MVKHIVCFQFLEEGDGRTKVENLQIAKEMLERLFETVPTLKAMAVHMNDERASAGNFDMILEAEYESWEDLNAYVVHPEHKKVGQFMAKVRKSRASVDYEF
ncbi:MAG: Dabb family protein [Christensenellaceae bacterium]|jgi:hypothetical protein|nr:Dabb family protein [Christensenellaceae bacterium]